jgi:hypothetical protein
MSQLPAPTFGAFLSHTVEQTLAEQQRALDVAARTEAAAVDLLKLDQERHFLAAMGDLAARMRGDHYPWTVESVGAAKDRFSPPGQPAVKAFVRVLDEASGRYVDVRYDDPESPGADGGYRISMRDPWGKDREVSRRPMHEVPRLLALFLHESRVLHEKHHAEMAAEETKRAEAARRQGEENAQRERSMKRRRRVEQIQSIAHGLEQHTAARQVNQERRRLAAGVWTWPENPDGSPYTLPYYIVTITLGGFTDAEGEEHFNTRDELMLDPNVHDGFWPFIKGKKLVPTKLVAAPPVTIATYYANRIEELPHDWKEDVYAEIGEFKYLDYEGPGGTIVRSDEGDHVREQIGRQPIELLRGWIDLHANRKWEPQPIEPPAADEAFTPRDAATLLAAFDPTDGEDQDAIDAREKRLLLDGTYFRDLARELRDTHLGDDYARMSDDIGNAISILSMDHNIETLDMEPFPEAVVAGTPPLDEQPDTLSPEE